jgi:hypothetical protein
MKRPAPDLVLSPEDQAYISGLGGQVSEADPALILACNHNALEAFVAAASGPLAAQPVPAFITRPISVQ